MALEIQSDTFYMKQALREAEKALEADEIPVGGIIVCKGHIIARAHNLTERLNDVTAHAEMQAITAAANYLGGKYLTGCTLYVTLEPCVMCAGALRWSQIENVVFGAFDEQRGFTQIQDNLLHPKTKVKSGLLGDESAEMLHSFFAEKRKDK